GPGRNGGDGGQPPLPGRLAGPARPDRGDAPARALRPPGTRTPHLRRRGPGVLRRVGRVPAGGFLVRGQLCPVGAGHDLVGPARRAPLPAGGWRGVRGVLPRRRLPGPLVVCQRHSGGAALFAVPALGRVEERVATAVVRGGAPVGCRAVLLDADAVAAL